MKIAIIAEISSYGGTKTYFFQLISFIKKKYLNALIDIYVDENVIFADNELSIFNKYRVSIFHYPKSLIFENKHFVRLGLSNIFYLFFFLRLKSLNYQRVIVSAASPFKFLVGSLVLGNLFIYILHTYPNHKLSGIARIIRPFYLIINNILFLLKPQIITVSKYSKQKILDYLQIKHNKNSIRVIYNTVNVTDINYLHEKINNIIDIYTVGHLVEYKNPHLWLKVAINIINANENVRFFWIGDGQLFNEIENLIPHNLKDRILLLGYQKNVISYLKEGNIYFQPSLLESHGISVLEAMSVGLATIVSKRGGLPESVEHNVTGLVAEPELHTMTTAIQYLIDNPDRRNEMGRKGYEKASRDFSFQKWENEMIGVLEHCKH